MPYIYNDEDNAPMIDDDFDFHNPTVYSSRAEMKAIESGIPFNDKPENGCWNCREYDGDRCMKYWNNLDPMYYRSERDDKKPDEICDDWIEEPGAVWDDFFGGNEP